MIRLFVLLTSFFALAVQAAEYPSMEGTWKGKVRIVSSGDAVSEEVSSGGAVIKELNVTIKVDYQDEEVFIGATSSDSGDVSEVPIWGAIRSTGKEAIFVTATGGRGQIWFETPTKFEICYARQVEGYMGANCSTLEKQQP